jgi:hypothetical protein
MPSDMNGILCVFLCRLHKIVSYPFCINKQACTIEKRSLSTRPGVRSSLYPTPIETIAVDCIGRVVQLTTHTRAIYGVGLEDRIAALYPFEYCEKGSDKGGGGKSIVGGKRKGLGRYALVDAG